MTEICDLPYLEVVPVDRLVLHERHDKQRTPPLVERLLSSGVLRNPPIVVPMDEKRDRFMVLDGANRVSAFRVVQIPHIVAQVVDLDDPGLELNTWNHVVWGASPQTFYRWLRQIPGLYLNPIDPQRAFDDLLDLQTLASVFIPDDRVMALKSAAIDLQSRVKALNAVVDAYKDRVRMDRTTALNLETLKALYPDLSGLVIFPPFEISQVIEMAGKGELFPPGCTRFSISPRVLHINYSLEALRAPKTAAEKNRELQIWLQNRCEQKAIRYYTEATFLFDE